VPRCLTTSIPTNCPGGKGRREKVRSEREGAGGSTRGSEKLALEFVGVFVYRTAGFHGFPVFRCSGRRRLVIEDPQTGPRGPVRRLGRCPPKAPYVLPRRFSPTLSLPDRVWVHESMSRADLTGNSVNSDLRKSIVNSSSIVHCGPPPRYATSYARAFGRGHSRPRRVPMVASNAETT